MAIISKGKLRGKVGNVIYRVVDGKTVVQSYPRPPKDGYPLTEQNARFAAATKMGSRLYKQLKDFGCHVVEARLFGNLTRFLMTHYEEMVPVGTASAGESDFGSAALPSGWRLIQGDRRLVMGRKALMTDFLTDVPKMRVSDGGFSLQIPGFPAYRDRLDRLQDAHGAVHPMVHRAAEVELLFMLLHYDLEMGVVQIVDRWSSGRLPRGEAYDSRTLQRDLLGSDGDLLDSGVLLGCFGVRLFASSLSTTHMNNEKYNPAEILGVWRG